MTLDSKQPRRVVWRLAVQALVGSAFCGAMLVAPSAGAAPEPITEAAVRTAARELATQGADAFERGDFAGALDLLTRAFALYPVPSISIMQARCLERLGRWVEALDRYEETRRMPLAEDASDAMRAAVRDAATEADVLRARIPRLSIEVRRDGRVPPGISVLLDGRVLPQALLDVDCPVDPGEHLVEVREAERQPVTRRVKVEEKDRVVLDISLNAPAERVVIEAPRPPPSTSVVPETHRWEPTTRWWWAMGAMGGGAVSLLGSVVSGVVALDKKSDLDKVCDPGCPAGSQDKIDSFRRYRTVSYVTGGASAVFVGVGGYLLLTDRRSGSHASLGLHPRGIYLTGSF